MQRTALHGHMSSGTHRGPNPLAVVWSVVRSLRRHSAPRPTAGSRQVVDHSRLGEVLEAVATDGVGTLPRMRSDLEAYRDDVSVIDPDTLDRAEALAFWLNVYNAGALDLAADALSSAQPTVLRVPGGFSRVWASIAGEALSLDAIEHAKIRRFKDPRVHGALVCGSASCPTLRGEPYKGVQLDEQLDAQLRLFFANGGAVLHPDEDGDVLYLSRILLWFGGDFVRPHRMPSFWPARKRTIARAVRPWLDGEAAATAGADAADFRFQPYDWSLACSVV